MSRPLGRCWKYYSSRPVSTPSPFFDEQQAPSRVKAEIVSKYFDAWSTAIVGIQDRQGWPDRRIGYIDLFAGPGRYADGAISTPLRVLELAIGNPKVAERLVSMFNDADEDNVNALETAFKAVPGINTLKRQPLIYREQVGDASAERWESAERRIPMLAFIDPFGYKGLTLRLLNALLRDWGGDALFFFNYKRINAAISNPLVERHMRGLFGDGTFEALRANVDGMSPNRREEAVLEALREGLGRYGEFLVPFTFRNTANTRTTHHLTFVTKNDLPYRIMKDIMAKASSYNTQGVPSFSFIPAERFQISLLDRPLDLLRQELLDRFAGSEKSPEELFAAHSKNTRYIQKNYQDACRELLDSGRVIVSRQPARPGTFAKDIKVRFPRK